jgi:extradiol dioxygenase family protein
MAFNVGLVLQRLGHTAAGVDDLAQARRYYQESPGVFTRIGSLTAKTVQTDLDNLGTAV